MPTYIRKATRNIGTSPVKIGSYTVPVGRASTIVGLNIANITDVLISANVYITNSTATLSYIVVNANIPVGSAFVPIGGDQKIILVAGDSISISSSVASSIDATLAIVESSN